MERSETRNVHYKKLLDTRTFCELFFVELNLIFQITPGKVYPTIYNIIYPMFIKLQGYGRIRGTLTTKDQDHQDKDRLRYK